MSRLSTDSRSAHHPAHHPASASALSRRSLIKGAAAALAATGLASAGAGIIPAFQSRPAFASEERTTLRLGVVDNYEIWDNIKERLADKGIDLEVIEFGGHATPNDALANGELDLNAFQHRVFLAYDCGEKGYELQNVGNTIISPLNLFSIKINSIDEFKEGDTVGVPSDISNTSRALRVLQAAGLIALKDPDSLSPTVEDIVENPKGIVITELANWTIPSALPDLTAGIVSGGYALDFGLSTDDIIFEDTNLDNKQYWNLIAARKEDVQNPERYALIKTFVDAYHSDEVLQILQDVYHGYYKPVGWDEDPVAEADGEALSAASSSADKNASSSAASAGKSAASTGSAGTETSTSTS